MAEINDAYYAQLGKSLRSCDLDQFSGVVKIHKANMLEAKFREPSEKVFAENLSWIARQIVMQSDGRHFKEAEDITDADLRKLEILREQYGFDYMKDLRIGFTVTTRGASLEYSQPFLVYLGSKKGDFTDYQTSLIGGLVERLKDKSELYMLGISYSMHSGRGNNHNDSKNLFHVLMEGELTPNKKKIADLVAPELAGKSYRIHANTESWEGSRGQRIYQPFDTYRDSLHSAVASGRLENVDYALSKGAKQSTRHDGYGSTAFADAVARNHDPAYHAIALRLFENALTLEKGAEILRTASRWEQSSDSPIEILARKGDLPFTVAMAHANAGKPEMAVNTFTYSTPVTLGGYHGVAGGEVITHGAVHTTRTKAEYQIVETGKMEDPFPYIHQAVFNLDPNACYDAYQNVYGMALKYLVKNGALEESDIPQDSLTDPRSLTFIFSLRAAAEAEKARDPSFLAKTATFTESFAAEVVQAKRLTDNFRSLYQPGGIPSADIGTDAFAIKANETEQPVAVKGPLQLNKEPPQRQRTALQLKRPGGGAEA